MRDTANADGAFVAAVMEIARKDDLEKLPEQLARVFSWWNAVANRMHIDLEEAGEISKE